MQQTPIAHIGRQIRSLLQSLLPDDSGNRVYAHVPEDLDIAAETPEDTQNSNQRVPNGNDHERELFIETAAKEWLDHYAPGFYIELEAGERRSLERYAAEQRISPLDGLKRWISERAKKTEQVSKLKDRWQNQLTERERQVVALHMLGLSDKEIVHTLPRINSKNTVKAHMTAALGKLGLRRRAHLRMLLEDWDFSAYDTHFDE